MWLQEQMFHYFNSEARIEYEEAYSHFLLEEICNEHGFVYTEGYPIRVALAVCLIFASDTQAECGQKKKINIC